MFSMRQRLSAELFGTFWLVLGGCGAAVLASGIPDVGIGYLGVAFAFGLTVVTMAYAVGHVSGGHFNPAITLGLALDRRFRWAEAVPYAVGHVSGGHFNPAITLGVALDKRFRWAEAIPYMVTQVVAAIVASAVLYVIANGVDGFSAKESGFATNGYGDRSPGGYDLLAVIVAEIVLTAVFLYVILGATDTRAPKGFAPLAIGLSLTLIHLVSIPVSNTSVNPARSTGPALFAGSEALQQLWVFWLVPIVAALAAGALYAWLFAGREPVSPLEVASEA